MRTIYLDIGNSTITFSEIIEKKWKVLSKTEIEEVLPDFLQGEGDVQIVTSSVRKELLNKLSNHYPDIDINVITHTEISPEYLAYETPNTLGIDRFLVCLGAVNYRQRDVIVVDAGSACTVDFMNSEKVYRGGVIMPGLQVLHNSVKDYLPELPPVDRKLPEKWPGNTTQNCLKWGLNGTFIGSIEQFILKMKKLAPNAQTWITGGDGKWVAKNINPDMNPIYAPDLIFEGMKAFVEEKKNRALSD